MAGVSAVAQSFPNAALGTTANLVVKFQAAATPAQVVTTTTADVTGAVGICLSSCSNTGTAVVITHGSTNCAFDGATTAGDYVTISTTIAGDCHDIGATQPVGSQVLGRVLSTNGVGGTYGITLNLMETERSQFVQTFHFTTCTTAGTSGGSICTGTGNLPATQADINYDLVCTLDSGRNADAGSCTNLNSGNPCPLDVSTYNRTTTNFGYQITLDRGVTTGSGGFGTLYCFVSHQ